MKQTSLFAVAPYLAGSIFLLGSIARLAWPRGAPVPLRRPDPMLLRRRSWYVGILVVLLAHGGAFLFPDAVLRWTRHPVRLLLLEVVAFAFAGLALFGLARAMLDIRKSEPPGRPGIGDRVGLTLLAVSILSGMATALLHRWGSAWGTAVLVPYAESILRLAPATEPVARLPFLARLHVLSGLAAIAVIPFTSVAAWLAWRRRPRHGAVA